MAAPAVHDVITKYRKFAFIMVAMAYCCCAGWFFFGALDIYAKQDNPPTVSQISYGSGISGDRWGNLPYVMLATNNHTAVITNLEIEHGWSEDFDCKRETDNDCKPSARVVLESETDSSVSVALVDLASLKPNFTAAGVAGAILEISLSLEVVHGYEEEPIALMVFSALPPSDGGKNVKHALRRIERHLSKMKASPLDTLQYHFETSVPMPKNMDYNLEVTGLSLTKSSVPSPGVCWGWELPLGQTPCVHTLVNMHKETSYGVPVGALKEDKEWGGARLKKGVRNVRFQVAVASQTVMKTRPMSMIEQFLNLCSQVGGFFAIISTFFYLFFVKVHPPCEPPPERELTPLTEKYKYLFITKKAADGEPAEPLLPPRP